MDKLRQAVTEQNEDMTLPFESPPQSPNWQKRAWALKQDMLHIGEEGVEKAWQRGKEYTKTLKQNIQHTGNETAGHLWENGRKYTGRVREGGEHMAGLVINKGKEYTGRISEKAREGGGHMVELGKAYTGRISEKAREGGGHMVELGKTYTGRISEKAREGGGYMVELGKTYTGRISEKGTEAIQYGKQYIQQHGQNMEDAWLKQKTNTIPQVTTEERKEQLITAEEMKKQLTTAEGMKKQLMKVAGSKTTMAAKGVLLTTVAFAAAYGGWKRYKKMIEKMKLPKLKKPCLLYAIDKKWGENDMIIFTTLVNTKMQGNESKWYCEEFDGEQYSDSIILTNEDKSGREIYIAKTNTEHITSLFIESAGIIGQAKGKVGARRKVLQISWKNSESIFQENDFNSDTQKKLRSMLSHIKYSHNQNDDWSDFVTKQ